MMSAADLALENYSLRVERNYGFALTFESGLDIYGQGYCQSFYRGFHMDCAVSSKGIDAAKLMHLRQPVKRLALEQFTFVKI